MIFFASAQNSASSNSETTTVAYATADFQSPFAPEFFAKMGFREVPKTKIMHKLYTGCINCTKHADPYTCPEIAMCKPLA